MKITVGSHNRKKLAEIRRILGDLGVDVAPLPEGAPDIVEDGATFAENARKKATELAAHVGGYVLSDDSGLEVEALGGRPGVHSARFGGEHGNDPKNIEKVLAMMEGQDDRRAAFRCCIVLAGPAPEGVSSDKVLITAEGSCTGTITREPRGTSGFGYDPIFIPDGYDRTFAEMPPEQKNSLSHRGKALNSFKQLLIKML